jgi:hypothetical protein
MNIKIGKQLLSLTGVILLNNEKLNFKIRVNNYEKTQYPLISLQCTKSELKTV